MGDRPQRGLGFFYGRLNGSEHADIDNHSERRFADILYFRRYIPHSDAASLARQSACTGQSDAAGSARDDSYVTIQFKLHLLIPSLPTIEERHHSEA